jgi:hypothetical protein
MDDKDRVVVAESGPSASIVIGKSRTGNRCSPLDSKHPPGLKPLNRTPGDSDAN